MISVLPEIPPHIFAEMSHFFRVYKELEGKETAVNEVLGAEAAQKVIQSAIEHYVEEYCR